MGTVLNLRYEKRILYPTYQQYRPIVSSVDRTSVTIQANFTHAGTWRCAAFPVGSVNATSVSDIFRAGYLTTFSTTAQNVSTTIQGLEPSTKYSILCYTEDFAGHVMPFSEALVSSSWEVITLCCKAIVLTQTNQIVISTSTSTVGNNIGGSTSLNAAQWAFRLFGTPKENVLVVVNVTSSVICPSTVNLVNPSLGTARVSPASFTFLKNTKDITRTFVIMGTPGCFILRATAMSAVETYANATFNFALLSNDMTVPAPAVLAGPTLSSDGLRVTFTFNSATSRPVPAGYSVVQNTQFPCSYLLNFDLVNASMCIWRNSTALQVRLGVNPKVVPGSSVVFIANRIQAACVASSDSVCRSQYPYMSRQVVTVLAPVTAVLPVVSLNAPRTLMSCDDLYLDPTGSTGAGGRAWSSIVWDVSGDLSPTNLTGIATFLNNNFAQDTKTVAIVMNRRLLIAEYSPQFLTFRLTLTNYLGQTVSSDATVTFRYSALSSPRLTIQGPSTSITYRPLPITLFANATYPACAVNTTMTMTYIWSVYSDLVLLTSMVSQSSDPRYFTLPAYTLDPGRSYTFQVRISFSLGTAYSVTSTARRTITVGTSGIQAVISQGLATSYALSDTLVFNGSRSYALDYPTRVPNSALTFAWSCLQTYPVYGAECGTNSYFPVQGSYYQLPAEYLGVGIFQTTLTVTSADGGFSQAVLTLNITNRNMPKVTMNQTADLVYNLGDKVILTATVLTNGNPAVATWTSSGFTTDQLSALSATSLSQSIPQASYGATFLSQLALNAYTLTEGSSFTFALTAYYTADGSSAVSSSAVRVTINAPPVGGILTVDPLQGNAFTTPFVFATNQWSDDAASLPLSFLFACYQVDARSALVLKDRDEVSTFTGALGQGLRSRGFNWYVVVNASDVFGGVSTVWRDDVQVFALQGTAISSATTVMISAFSTAVSSAWAQRNPVQVTQLIGAALSTVNSVSCAPPVACSRLNRALCSTTPNTCGACLAGFTGLEGDANTPCNTTASLNRIGETCTGNFTCVSGYCARTSSTSRVCQALPKACPANCNSRGSCLYADVGSGRSLDTCTQNDDTCIAYCVCNNQRYGRDCSLFPSSYSEQLTFRASLCSNLRQTLTIQDASVVSLQTRATTIAQILLDPSILTTTALTDCTIALLDTLEAIPSSTCANNAVANQLTQALQAITSVFSGNLIYNMITWSDTLRQSLSLRITQALQTLGSACHEQQAIGESAPATFLSGGIHVSTYVSSASTLSNTIYSVAMTDFQRFQLGYVDGNGNRGGSTAADGAVPSLTLSDSEGLITGQETLGLTLVQIANNAQLIGSYIATRAPSTRPTTRPSARPTTSTSTEESNVHSAASLNASVVYLRATVRRGVSQAGIVKASVHRTHTHAHTRTRRLVSTSNDMSSSTGTSRYVDAEDMEYVSGQGSGYVGGYDVVDIEEVEEVDTEFDDPEDYAQQQRRLQVTTLPLTLTLTLPNTRPVYYPTVENITISLACLRYQSTSYQVNGSCPYEGPQVTQVCPARNKVRTLQHIETHAKQTLHTVHWAFLP